MLTGFCDALLILCRYYHIISDIVYIDTSGDQFVVFCFRTLKKTRKSSSALGHAHRLLVGCLGLSGTLRRRSVFGDVAFGLVLLAGCLGRGRHLVLVDHLKQRQQNKPSPLCLHLLQSGSASLENTGEDQVSPPDHYLISSRVSRGAGHQEAASD